MRNSYGSQYFAMTEMAVHKTPLDVIEKFQPQISEILSLGADMRTQYIYDESSALSTFFEMEGNFYVNAQLNDRFSATLKKGLYDGFEAFGTGYVLPWQGYVRIGKFQPSYGWRFDDHTSFVREKTLWPPTSTDTGMEFGLYPQGISANFGFYNGSGGVFDDGKGKAASSRLEVRRNIGGVGIGLGGSVFFNDRPAGDATLYGPFYYLNLGTGKFIYMGEADWLDQDILDNSTVAFATTHKLSYMLSQGIWFSGEYDFYDPDTDAGNGDIARYGVGLNYYPYGFLEISPMIRYYDDKLSFNDKYILFNSQVHLFF